MPLCRDITTDSAWIDEQVDRLLAFELLTKAVSGDPTPVSNALLVEKIGVHRGFTFGILGQIRERY
jgi:hypothetical protein